MSLIPFLRQTAPQAGILVLTSNDDYRTVLEAIQLGVDGYVLKDTPVAALRQAILDVHEGGTVIDPQLSRLVLKAFQDKGNGEDNPLSKRERQVLELMAMGYAKKDVANELGISYSAVALYAANIYQKLQVPNIVAAVSTAIRKGLI
jgi:DNA-binding NarL/FixJ family response regulator